MDLQLEDKSGAASGTPVTPAYLLLEAAGSSRKGLVPACCLLVARAEKKSNLSLSPWVTSPAHPEPTVWFPFKCLIKYQYATSGEAKYFILSLSNAVNTFHCSIQWLCSQKDLAPRFVWIWPEREFWLGWWLSASVWRSALSLPTATEPPDPQSLLQPRVGRHQRGSRISSDVKFPLPLPPGVEATPAAKVREFRSFTQENLKALLNSK